MVNLYESRATTDYFLRDLPLGHEKNIKTTFDPTAVRILENRDKKLCFDIGSIAYGLRRSAIKRSDGKQSYSQVEVVRKSLKKERIDTISSLLTELHLLVKIGRYEESTIATHLYGFMRHAAWCDINSFPKFLNSPDKARESIQAYNDYAAKNVKVGEMTVTTLTNRHSATIFIYTKLFGLQRNEFMTGLNIIQNRSTTSVEPPSEKDVFEALGVYSALFYGMVDIVQQKKIFPVLIEFPKEKIWFFANQLWCANAELLSKRDTWKRKHMLIDYENGRYFTFDEIKARNPDTSYYYSDVRKRIEKYTSASKNLKDPNVVNMLSAGCKAYLMLFLSNTGMNFASVAELKWNDNWVLSNERQGFKSIKKRANSKCVEFHIGNDFVHDFKKYLTLRKALLGNRKYAYLFFHIGHGKELNTITAHTLSTFIITCRTMIDKDTPGIKSRQWRSNKSNFMQGNFDVSTTAMVMQNSEETTLNKYSEGRAIDAAEEFTDYFDELDKFIYQKEVPLELISAGKCKDPENPSKSVSTNLPSPDCVTPEGCLYCDKFGVHADLPSLRKLLSMRYVIIETKSLYKDEYHFKLYCSGVISRIDAIVNEIKNTSKKAEQLVVKVLAEVENEILDPYWDAKLTMLVRIGAI